jgi:hypothetical protein
VASVQVRQWFDWGVAASNQAVGIAGTHFFAGLSLERPAVFEPEWCHVLETGIPAATASSSGLIEFRSWSGRERRLRRLAQPQDVLSGSTLEAQGQSLGLWVQETLDAVIAFGPP